MAFTYQMEVFISPFDSFAPDTITFNNALYPQGSEDAILRSNRWLEAVSSTNIPPSPYIFAATGALNYNLFDVRLRFSWPVLQNGAVGPGRQTYRSLVASPLTRLQINPTTTPPTNWWFFQPQVFTNQPQGL
jgi:hypothetical protein